MGRTRGRHRAVIAVRPTSPNTINDPGLLTPAQAAVDGSVRAHDGGELLRARNARADRVRAVRPSSPRASWSRQCASALRSSRSCAASGSRRASWTISRTSGSADASTRCPRARSPLPASRSCASPRRASRPSSSRRCCSTRSTSRPLSVSTSDTSRCGTAGPRSMREDVHTTTMPLRPRRASRAGAGTPGAPGDALRVAVAVTARRGCHAGHGHPSGAVRFAGTHVDGERVAVVTGGRGVHLVCMFLRSRPEDIGSKPCARVAFPQLSPAGDSLEVASTGTHVEGAERELPCREDLDETAAAAACARERVGRDDAVDTEPRQASPARAGQ